MDVFGERRSFDQVRQEKCHRYYYNPLTGKMFNYFNGNSRLRKDAVEFGTESDYNTNFPEESGVYEFRRVVCRWWKIHGF